MQSMNALPSSSPSIQRRCPGYTPQLTLYTRGAPLGLTLNPFGYPMPPMPGLMGWSGSGERVNERGADPCMNPATLSAIPLMSDHVLHLPLHKSSAHANRRQSLTSEYTTSLSITTGPGALPNGLASNKTADTSSLPRQDDAPSGRAQRAETGWWWCVVLLKGRLWVRLVTILADGSRQGGEHEKKGTDKSLTCKQ